MNLDIMSVSSSSQDYPFKRIIQTNTQTRTCNPPSLAIPLHPLTTSSARLNISGYCQLAIYHQSAVRCLIQDISDSQIGIVWYSAEADR